jgi:hypothetical protein
LGGVLQIRTQYLVRSGHCDVTICPQPSRINRFSSQRPNNFPTSRTGGIRNPNPCIGKVQVVFCQSDSSVRFLLVRLLSSFSASPTLLRMERSAITFGISHTSCAVFSRTAYQALYAYGVIRRGPTLYAISHEQHAQISSRKMPTLDIILKLKKTDLHGLSPRANYTDRATAACWRSDCQLLRIEGATWSAAVFSVL